MEQNLVKHMERLRPAETGKYGKTCMTLEYALIRLEKKMDLFYPYPTMQEWNESYRQMLVNALREAVIHERMMYRMTEKDAIREMLKMTREDAQTDDGACEIARRVIKNCAQLLEVQQGDAKLVTECIIAALDHLINKCEKQNGLKEAP